jgi:hypothetical protein
VRTLKSRLGVMGVLVPIFYCGSLLYYFLDLSGSMQDAEKDGLGPTLIGLGAISLLFSIPFIMKVVRILARPRSPGSGGGPDASTRDDEDGFDADAAIARYMVRRSAEAVPNAPAVPPAREGGGPARRPGFGRKIR